MSSNICFSNLTSGETPTRILLKAGESGLSVNSWALCDNISPIGKLYLEQDPYGEIAPKSFKRIKQGIQIAIAIF